MRRSLRLRARPAIEGVSALTHDRWPLLAFAAALTATGATLWLVRLGHALGRRQAGAFAVGFSRRSALTALAALTAVAGVFGLLALRDRRFPNVLGGRSDHHEATGQRSFEMNYACDERCTLSGPRLFVQGTGAAVIDEFALEFSEIPTLGENFASDEERSSLTEEGVSLPRRGVGEPVNVLLSPAQARQLVRSLSPGEEAALFFTVSDHQGNRAASAVMLTRSGR